MGKHRRRPVVARLLDLTAWSGAIGLIGVPERDVGVGLPGTSQTTVAPAAKTTET